MASDVLFFTREDGSTYMNRVKNTNKEFWIDLFCLGLFNYIEDGYVCFKEIFSKDNPHKPYNNTTLTLIRRILRDIKYFKIVKWITVSSEFEIESYIFKTDIPEEDWVRAKEEYKKWTEKIWEGKHAE